jgi:CubicO group peptidase (beta-lactamase class C family)
MKTEAMPAAVSRDRADQRFSPALKVLEEAIATRAFPGCACGVLADGKVLLEAARGQFTYDADAPQVTPQTVFDIASITKVVATTAAAMLLYQRGILELDTPLGELLPGFVVGREAGERARHVQIRHLLAHSSGLPGYVELFRTATTADGILRGCLQLPIGAEPGARAEYSDPGFILLGKALEVLIRAPLDSWVQREIFQPLDLSSSGFNPGSSAKPFIPPTEEDLILRERRIQGEVQDENAWRLKGVAGHAGVFSNVRDLLRFAGSVLAPSNRRSEVTEPLLFSGETVEVFAERQGPSGSTRALGWDTPSAKESSAGQFFPVHSIGHLGYSGCSLWIDLDASIAVVLLTNRTWPDRSSQLIREVRPAFHDAIRQALS